MASRVLGRIVNIVANEEVLDETGRIDAGKLDAFAFDLSRNRYYAIREEVGRAWNSGKEPMPKK